MLRLSDSELGHVTSLIVSEAESILSRPTSGESAESQCSRALACLWSRVGSLLEPLLFTPVSGRDSTAATCLASSTALVTSESALERTLRFSVLRPLLVELLGLRLLLDDEPVSFGAGAAGAGAGGPAATSTRALLVRHLLWILYRHRPRVLSSLAAAAAHCCTRSEPQTGEKRNSESDLERLCRRQQVPVSAQPVATPQAGFTDIMCFYLWFELLPPPPASASTSGSSDEPIRLQLDARSASACLDVYASRSTSVLHSRRDLFTVIETYT